MRKSSPSSGRRALAGGRPTDPAERVGSFLRSEHPVKTGAHVEVATGGRIAADRFHTWSKRGGACALDAFLVLIEVYGARFLAYVLGDGAADWLCAAAAEAEARAIEAEIAERRARLADLAALRQPRD